MSTSIRDLIKAIKVVHPKETPELIQIWHDSAVEFGQPLTVVEFTEWLTTQDA